MRDKDYRIFEKMDVHIKDIFLYTKGMDFSDFRNDKKTVDASAFLVGQIGEVAKYLSDEAMQESSQIPWRNVKGLRNRIVHDYENVDNLILWKTIKENLPQLSSELNKLLEKEVCAALDGKETESMSLAEWKQEMQGIKEPTKDAAGPAKKERKSENEK